MYSPQCSLHTALPVLLLVVVVLPAGIRSQDTTVFDKSSPPIYCFQCNSGIHPDCPNLQANNTNSIYYQACTEYGDYRGAKPFCRKIVQTIFERENMVRVIRKCGWEKHARSDCYYMSNDDHMETVCQCFHSGCNDAPRTTLATTTLVTGLTLSYFLVS